MNMLIFKLISNKKEEINEKVPYYINNDNIKFKIGNTLYKYNLEKDVLIKCDSDISLTIDPDNYIIYVKLMEQGLEFNIPIDDVKIEKNNNEITIKYTLLSDEITENEIYLKY